MNELCNVHGVALEEFSTMSSSFCSGCVFVSPHEAMHSNYPMFLKYPSGFFTCKNGHTYKKIHYYYCPLCYDQNPFMWYIRRFVSQIIDIICGLFLLLFSFVCIVYACSKISYLFESTHFFTAIYFILIFPCIICFLLK
jgi:hypothetical protein